MMFFRIKGIVRKAVVFMMVLGVFLGLFPQRLSAQGDKLLHFGVSVLFGAAGESVLHYTTEWKNFTTISLGTTLGTIPGLIKEIFDSTKEGGRFSAADLAADFGGALFGSILSNVVNNLIQVSIKREKQSRTFILSLSYSF